MARCPLCDRAFQRGVLCPVWWSHYEVCRRPSCRAVAEDALNAIETAREEYDELAEQIEQRNTDRAQEPLPVGWKSDTMVRLDHDDEDWWGLDAAKLGHRGGA